MEVDIVTLSPARLKEFYPVFELILRSEFPSYSQKDIDYLINSVYTLFNLEFWLREGSKYVLQALDRKNKTVVGFALIDAPYGGVSLCRWLGVLKPHQRKGVGRKLIDRWLAEAAKSKCHKMELAAQTTAKGFYEQVGLELEGFRKKSYFGADQYVFGKVLT